MRILLAIDGSPCSNTAVEEVARRPWPEGSSIKVLTTFELPVPPTEGWALPATYFDDLDLALQQKARNTTDRAVAKLKPALAKTVSLDAQILPGPPRNVILEVAEDWRADLIVVGSHGYRAWERLLLGSVSQAVVSHAKCSVEVVRCKTTKSTEKGN
jgi:nucleotide-binding universal stress UspA family protein